MCRGIPCLEHAPSKTVLLDSKRSVLVHNVRKFDITQGQKESAGGLESIDNILVEMTVTFNALMHRAVLKLPLTNGAVSMNCGRNCIESTALAA
jgi:hypothetical protein